MKGFPLILSLELLENIQTTKQLLEKLVKTSIIQGQHLRIL